MPTHYQTWAVTAFYGREAQERHGESVEVQVGPNNNHVEVTMSVCAIIGQALCSMKIDESDIDEGFDLIVDVRRIR